ncbi:MAG: YybH family protein [Planctomycetota bacterium]|jgi:ketosteroid isomerase-like protein
MKVLPIIVVLILAGCIKQTNLPEDTIMSKQPEDIAAIRQLAEDWRGGWLAGDAETLVALLSDEPVLIMSSEDPIIGKEAIRELYHEVDGDLGYIWSRYTNTETPKAGGETIEDHGHSVLIVRRQHDGSWKIARLIATRSQPTTNSQ